MPEGCLVLMIIEYSSDLHSDQVSKANVGGRHQMLGSLWRTLDLDSPLWL